MCMYMCVCMCVHVCMCVLACLYVYVCLLFSHTHVFSELKAQKVKFVTSPSFAYKTISQL